ncbi:NPHP3 [Symbiodinium sp. CCMP2592]|nr:NPHP3 [Symbiodinium sp. CCMP2592]
MAEGEEAGPLPACPDGHSLEPDERPDHFCDSCDKHGTHYSCPKDCDYDLCKYCFAHLQQHPPPEQRARLKREDAELSAYFGGPYFEGAVLQSKQYEASKVHNVYSFRYNAPDGYVHVWRHVFDLRELNSASRSKQEDAVVLYHYTNELTFLNVGDMQLTAAKLLASLVDSRAHFGKGIYVTQHEPAVWGRRMRVLLNNYSNGSPLRADLEDADSQEVLRTWSGRSGHCIPLVVPAGLAYNIFERQTPDMQEKRLECDGGRPIALGEDYKGRAVDRNRDVWVIRITDQTGQILNALHDAEAFVSLLRTRLEKLRLQSNGEGIATCIMELAQRLAARGQHEESEDLYRECLELRRKQFGDMNPNTLTSMNNLAELLKAQGKFEEAESLHRESLAGWRTHGNAPNTLASIGNLAELLRVQGRHEEAEPLQREALIGSRKQFGQMHPNTLRNMHKMAMLSKVQGNLQEAESLFREAEHGCRLQFGPVHPETLACISNLAELLRTQDRLEESEPLQRVALDGSRKQLGDTHPNTLRSVNNLAMLLKAQGRCDEAETLFRETLKGRRAQMSDHPDTLATMENLAELLRGQGRLEEAEPLFREALGGCRTQFDAAHPQRVTTTKHLAMLLEARGMSEEAVTLLREVVDTWPEEVGYAEQSEVVPSSLSQLLL